MARIKIKTKEAPRVTKTGAKYIKVIGEDDVRYFVWEQNWPLLNGVEVGDTVEAELYQKGDAFYINSLTKVNETMDDDVPEYEDYPEEPDYDPAFASIEEPVPEPPAPKPARVAPKPAPVAPAAKTASAPVAPAPKTPAAAPAVEPAAPKKTAPAKAPAPAKTAPEAKTPSSAPAVSVAPAPTAKAPVSLPTYGYEPDTTDYSDNPNMSLYQSLREVPANARKDFTRGSFAGTDINPQFRIKRLTENFGPVGQGWKYTVDKRWTETCGNAILAFVDISLYYRKENGEWSDAVPGNGGSVLYDQNGANDEAFKMAETDAFGKACQKLGLGADVYWAAGATKYTLQ